MTFPGTKEYRCKEMIRILKQECIENGVVLEDQIKYIIATAQWETNHECYPVREAYWLNEDWRKRHLCYYPFYGRGFVQLTWKENYEKFSKILDVDLVNEPDLALLPQYAAKIIVIGMRDGLFTGVGLDHFTDYFGKVDYENARRIVNGTDKAEVIASMANDISLA